MISVRLRDPLAVAAVASLGVLAFSNTFANAFHFDDSYAIVDNFAIRDVRNLRLIWDFWPMRFITFYSLAWNYHWAGLSVFGYHLMNLLIHGTTAALAGWLTVLTLRTPALREEPLSGQAVTVGIFAGAIFLLHPLQTQSVNYLIQRGVLWVGLFYTAAMCFYVKARQPRPAGNGTGALFYAAALAMAALAAFSKELAISLPFMVCLYEFCFLKGDGRRGWRWAAPFFLMIVLMGAVMQATHSVNFLELRKATDGPAGISTGQYCLTQLKVLATYLRLLVFPFHQNLAYDYPIARTLWETPVLLSLGLLLLVIGVAAGLWRKFRFLSFGIFWFLIALVPESSLVPIKDVIFEHRLYLPVAGFSFFLAAGACYIFKGRHQKWAFIALAVLVGGYALLTYQRNKVWRSEYTLWDDVIHKSPRLARAYLNRGAASHMRGDIGPAFQDYNKAIELGMDDPIVFNNRGMIFQSRGDVRSALADYDEGIRLNPLYAGIWNSRGVAYRAIGQLDAAIRDFSMAVKINRYYTTAIFNRGTTYQLKGDLDPALADYDAALRQDPRLGAAYANRARIYLFRREEQKGWADVQKARDLGLTVNMRPAPP